MTVCGLKAASLNKSQSSSTLSRLAPDNCSVLLLLLLLGCHGDASAKAKAYSDREQTQQDKSIAFDGSFS